MEVGSYKGKSTVILGSVIRAFFPGSKVYAIDPHEGIVGAEGQDLRVLESSLQMFNYNIANEGLIGVVELIKECSFNVNGTNQFLCCLLMVCMIMQTYQGILIILRNM